MMTAYALARIFSKLFGEVDFAAIDTDRNKYPIGSGRVIFTSIHSYFSAMTVSFDFFLYRFISYSDNNICTCKLLN